MHMAAGEESEKQSVWMINGTRLLTAGERAREQKPIDSVVFDLKYRYWFKHTILNTCYRWINMHEIRIATDACVHIPTV